ncbi:MAG TPA: hypothetical protein VJ692_10335, partial [Nitrospiraceae bacterium]|nr:hypothetical protein [Nitrospiraceae bacterium]
RGYLIWHTQKSLSFTPVSACLILDFLIRRKLSKADDALLSEFPGVLLIFVGFKDATRECSDD